MLNELVDILEKEAQATKPDPEVPEKIANGPTTISSNGQQKEPLITWVHKNFQVCFVCHFIFMLLYVFVVCNEVQPHPIFSSAWCLFSLFLGNKCHLASITFAFGYSDKINGGCYCCSIHFSTFWLYLAISCTFDIILNCFHVSFSVTFIAFQGILTNETRCLRCETVTARDETFLDLSLDIEQNSSITSCLKNFSSTETLNAEDKFFCDKCCRLVTFFIAKLPCWMLLLVGINLETAVRFTNEVFLVSGSGFISSIAPCRSISLIYLS